MENKFYTLAQVQKFCDEASFKFVRLEDKSGNVLIPFSTGKAKTDNGIMPVAKMIKKFEQRINSELTPDGVYFVRCKNSVTNTACELFPIMKGDVKDEVPVQQPIQQAPALVEKTGYKMSYEEAVKLIQRNAELESEHKRLTEKVLELEGILAEYEEEQQELAEAPPAVDTGVGSFITAQAPVLVSLLDRYMTLQESKAASRPAPTTQAPRVAPKPIEIGTEAHLLFIDKLVKAENFERLERELERVQRKNPTLFREILEKYNLVFEEEQELEDNEEELTEE